MIELLNVLYVMTQGSGLNLDHDTVRVAVEGETKLRAPLIRLGGIVAFGNVTISPFLIHRCAEDGRSITWLTRSGRFKGRLDGGVRGNVLLRRSQHVVLDVPGWPARLARQFVAAKIQNSRLVLMRAARERGGPQEEPLRDAAERLASILVRLRQLDDLNLVRGAEGEAARTYFGVFGHLVRYQSEAFSPDGRTRRPPGERDPLLSLCAAPVRVCRGCRRGWARPTSGLPARAEARPAGARTRPDGGVPPPDRGPAGIDADQSTPLQPSHFETTAGGAVHLTDDGRKAVISAYQHRKEQQVTHGILKQRVPLGLLPHIQARLLARHLRGDLPHYPPFIAH